MPLNKILKSQERVENSHLFEKFIGYKFQDLSLLAEALTTPQLGNELGEIYMDYDKRLETLGDAVLKTILILKINKEFEKTGDLKLLPNISKIKQAIENNKAFVSIGEEHFQLAKYICKAHQDIKGTKIIADVLEAVSGAIFLDCGMDLSIVEKVIVDKFYPDWIKILEETDVFNVNMLLEFVQKEHRLPQAPRIIIEYESYGVDNEPVWIGSNPKIVDHNGNILNDFKGLESKQFKNKPEAKKDLCREMYKKLKREESS
jgi:dsRNA-specific ribonuclease